jgi:regulator of sirC expression with transglutaminase-like and TPR domain
MLASNVVRKAATMTDPVSLFAGAVRGPADEVDLARASLAVAAGADPTLDPAPSLEALDRFAEGVSGLDGLRTRLFGELGFTGNTADYYDLENSFLNRVIERRLGIPLTLSIVMLEVGRRAGVDLQGIGMPGHFLVQDRTSGSFVDAFNGGELLDGAGCEARWRQVSGAGPEVPFRPGMLPPVGKRAILARMLMNLATVYRHQGRFRDLEWVLRMRLELPEVEREEALGLAETLSALGRFDEAAIELESRSAEDPEPARSARFLEAAKRIRARLN